LVIRLILAEFPFPSLSPVFSSISCLIFLSVVEPIVICLDPILSLIWRSPGVSCCVLSTSLIRILASQIPGRSLLCMGQSSLCLLTVCSLFPYLFRSPLVFSEIPPSPFCFPRRITSFPLIRPSFISVSIRFRPVSRPLLIVSPCSSGHHILSLTLSVYYVSPTEVQSLCSCESFSVLFFSSFLGSLTMPWCRNISLCHIPLLMVMASLPLLGALMLLLCSYV